jgi:dTDP-4-dehydrorhamnose 3,5-epimerase
MEPRKDPQWVDAAGAPVAPRIQGVEVRRAVVQSDERGSLCEIFDPRWGFTDVPLTYVYQFTIRPGKVKGWHVHKLHHDRIFLSQGVLKVVLWDSRPDSPTYGMINEIYRSQESRDLMLIPIGVFHAHQNVGNVDALCISMPTRAYQHADPDVYRLPLDNDVIPYRFDSRLGW